MIKKLSAIFLIIAMLAMLTPCAFAKVVTTKEPTNGSTVYIAGNPDMYPLEYFDKDTNSYKGIIPTMFKKLSKQSGLDFSYISSGDKNEQKRLAKNKQVEVVSVHFEGEAGALKSESFIMSLSKNGKERKVCVGFTEIAPENVKTAVSAALNSSASQEMLRAAVENADEYKPESFPYYLLIIIGALGAAVVVLVIIIVRTNLKKKRSAENKLEDKLTGIGNREYFDYWYPRQITMNNYVLYYIAYISIEAEKLAEYANVKVSEEVQVFASQTISSSAGDNDICARVSDGVFLLAYQAPSKAGAEQYIDEILKKLNNSANENMERYNVYFHAGVFHLDNPNTTLEKAALNAKLGCNYARKNNAPYIFSDNELLSREDYMLNLRKRLSDAIANNEFKLYVQYIFDAKKRCACGAEVLSRWHSIDKGIIYPGDYIKLLETANLISSLDYHNIESSCKLLEEWSNSDKANLWISCNLTRNTLSEEDFSEKFGAILNKYNINRELLVIEITEDMLAQDSAVAIKNIAACKEMGVRISLDDFGNGYSSVRDLCDYPIDIIKIDRQIITKAVTPRGNSLLQGLVKLAHYLNTLVLCEGVETEEELSVSELAECDFVQGYIYSKVYPADEPSIDKLINFKPVQPEKPAQPERPAQSEKPVEAAKPVQPAQPVNIEQPKKRELHKPPVPAATKRQTPRTARKTVRKEPKRGLSGILNRRKRRKQEELLNLIDKYLD